MRRVAFTVALVVLLAGCDRPAPDNAAVTTNIADNAGTNMMANDAENAAEPPRSILRPEVIEKEEPPKIEPVNATVSFGASPMKLDDEARKAIDVVLNAPATEAGGAIILRGHSDSRGTDGDNMVASRIRAELVRDYLIEKGVAKERISIVALGEGKPIAPNVKDDGSDDPEGREKNRRVEITVAAPPQTEVPAKDDAAKP